MKFWRKKITFLSIISPEWQRLSVNPRKKIIKDNSIFIGNDCRGAISGFPLVRLLRLFQQPHISTCTDILSFFFFLHQFILKWEFAWLLLESGISVQKSNSSYNYFAFIFLYKNSNFSGSDPIIACTDLLGFCHWYATTTGSVTLIIYPPTIIQ